LFTTTIAAGMAKSNLDTLIYYLIKLVVASLVVASFSCFESMRISQFDPNYQKFTKYVKYF